VLPLRFETQALFCIIVNRIGRPRRKSLWCAKMPGIAKESGAEGRLTLKRAGRNHACNLSWTQTACFAGADGAQGIGGCLENSGRWQRFGD
jgi:hypothetical protein